jgi:uridine kinase
MLIGVAGGSGSGKTTFVRDLAARLGPDRVVVVQQDFYYIDRSHQFKGDGSLNFDHPNSLDWPLMASHLRDLRDGKAVEMPIYDFATHSRKKETVRVQPKPVILVDGILIFCPKEIVDLLDLKIFIETSESVRFERRLKRDVTERGRTPEGVREQYITTVKPMHDEFVEPSKALADKIISGERPFGDEIKQIISRYCPV